MREIGSEFWKPRKQHISDDETLFLCGRTALDAIVKDAIRTYGILSALLPSYCCHTMIEPFLRNGISVRFYDIYVNEDAVLSAEIPVPKEKELLYIMKYFGDTDIRYEGAGSNLTGWATSVEDLTHSCFASDYNTNADYWFASYRKWFAIEGIAVAGKRKGRLSGPFKGQNSDYIYLRSKAFSLKQQFIDGEILNKQCFLSMFSEAEDLLSRDYIGYGVGYEETHNLFSFMDKIEDVKDKRRCNAQILTDGLNDIDGIKVFADFQDDRTCPLFVPAVIGDGKRDALRSYLISRDIYCPVHWPLSEYHVGLSARAVKVYNQELSFVCDQRYSEDDMKKMLNIIYKFFYDKEN